MFFYKFNFVEFSENIQIWKTQLATALPLPKAQWPCRKAGGEINSVVFEWNFLINSNGGSQQMNNNPFKSISIPSYNRPF